MNNLEELQHKRNELEKIYDKLISLKCFDIASKVFDEIMKTSALIHSIIIYDLKKRTV